jgi:transcriptional regulator with XRE-family HTH domain
MQDDSFSEQLRLFMRERHLSQTVVANEAKISQSTVSRALKGTLEREGPAKAKLFTYMQQVTGTEVLRGKGKERVVKAFESIWDGSEEHATAIAKIINASKELRPIQRSGGNR